MDSQLPIHIRQSIARQSDLERRKEDIQRYQRTAQATEWAEKQASTKLNPKDVAARAKEIRSDTKEFASQLLLIRRERMRELYEAEMAAWEEALARKGLAVERTHL